MLYRERKLHGRTSDCTGSELTCIFRSLPTRWADTQIVVSDSVLIQSPYTLDSIKAPADKVQAENHVRKVVERFYQRKKGAASGGAARAPVAVPNAPRKGG
jgi:hypothetical protein